MKADNCTLIINSVETPNEYPYKVGLNCLLIEEHKARGEGDRWYYDVWITEKDFHRIFNVTAASITTTIPMEE